MASLKRNFIIDIASPTPRRWTRYRGLTSDARRGLIIGGVYYRTMNMSIPTIEKTLMVSSPLSVTITIGNADNLATDLAFDAANTGSVITITKLTFADTPWDPSLPPVIASSAIWFDGYLAKPSFRGSKILIECRANVGRRGKSPFTDSSRLMTSHTPPPDGTKLGITFVSNGGG